MANIIVDIEKGVEVVAGDLLGWLTKADSLIASNGPKAVAALAVLAGAVEKALADVTADAANPMLLTIDLGTDVSDFKALWPDVTALLATLGIKLP